MGSESGDAHPEDGEGPIRAEVTDAFFMEQTAVTNAAFDRFAAATGYITDSERFGWSSCSTSSCLLCAGPRPALFRALAGGCKCTERAGATRPGPAHPWQGWRITRWCTSVGETPPHMAPGWENVCRRKRSGNVPPAVVWSSDDFHGETNSPRAPCQWPTSGRAGSPITTLLPMAMWAPLRLTPSRPTVSASTTWSAMSGNGAPGLSPRGARSRCPYAAVLICVTTRTATAIGSVRVPRPASTPRPGIPASGWSVLSDSDQVSLRRS